MTPEELKADIEDNFPDETEELKQRILDYVIVKLEQNK